MFYDTIWSYPIRLGLLLLFFYVWGKALLRKQDMSSLQMAVWACALFFLALLINITVVMSM